MKISFSRPTSKKINIDKNASISICQNTKKEPDLVGSNESSQSIIFQKSIQDET